MAGHRSRAYRVLVVDDEVSARTFAVRVLQSADYDTFEGSDGPESLQLVKAAGPFDLLLTDQRMPKMDGTELARQLRRTLPDLKVLYMTGYSDALFADRATLWEHEAFIEKPFTAAALLEAVSLILFGETRSQR
jgi:two-component system cell cycle sensor histidine kinase/response regulator CckA